MKLAFYISAIVVALSGFFSYSIAHAEAEVKKVCIDVMKDGKPVKDAKGNTKQTCKDVKQHKKLEGTKVPEKK